MRLPLLFFCAASTLAATAAAQHELLYYRFDTPAADGGVTNYVGGVGTPTEGTLHGQSGAGAFGRGGLPATPTGGTPNALDTGWLPVLNGDFTVAMFVHNRFANTPTQRSVLFGAGGFTGAVGGTPAGGFTLAGWGGNDLVLDGGLAWCFANGWTHFAVVVDAAGGVATVYRDGVAHATTPVTATPRVSSSIRLHIGHDGNGADASAFDIDEVRVLDRAASPAEVLAWSQGPTAVVAQLGASTGPTLSHFGGVPSPGNLGFGLAAQSAPFVPGALVLGLARADLDLGVLYGSNLAAGVLVADPLVVAPFAFDAAGAWSIDLSIPAGTTLASEVLLAQVLSLDSVVRVSTAVALGLGHPGHPTGH